MKLHYRYTSAAEEEAANSILFYRDISLDLARDFVDELDRIIQLLRKSPFIGTPTSSGFRKFPLPKFPFTIHYKPDSEVVVIYAVAHQSRRPDYWRSRI